MKKAAVFVNGFYRPKGLTYQIEHLTERFSRRGVRLDVIDNQSITVHLEGGEIVCSLPEVDFIVYLDKDKHIAYMLEKAGHRLFNSAESIELCDDKIRTYIALAGHGIDMPRTYSAPIMYKLDTDDAAFVAHIEENLAYPMVIKEAYGSLGMQVYLAETPGQLRAIRERVKFKPHLYQEYVGERFGCDVRVLLVGGKVVTAILRKSDTDFRSNIELGGRAYPHTLNPACCRGGAGPARGVDILFGPHDSPVLCEVNSNAFFSAAESVTGADVAGAYTDYIMKEVYGI